MCVILSSLHKVVGKCTWCVSLIVPRYLWHTKDVSSMARLSAIGVSRPHKTSPKSENLDVTGKRERCPRPSTVIDPGQDQDGFKARIRISLIGQ